MSETASEGHGALLMLDCSTLATSLRSLAALAHCDENDLRQQLVGVQLDAAFSAELLRWPYEKLLFRRCQKLGLAIGVPDAVVWFHGTRVSRQTSFDDGLLPLARRIEPLRSLVWEIADGLAIPHGIGHASGSYCMKLASMREQGPDASLLREAVIAPKRPTRDFLHSPEIVEDLAQERAGDRFDEVISAYRKSTQSCIVKFLSRDPRPDAVERALAYCHASLHGQDEPVHWNTCFAGRGQVVPAGDILSIEWIDDRL